MRLPGHEDKDHKHRLCYAQQQSPPASLVIIDEGFINISEMKNKTSNLTKIIYNVVTTSSRSERPELPNNHHKEILIQKQGE